MVHARSDYLEKTDHPPTEMFKISWGWKNNGNQPAATSGRIFVMKSTSDFWEKYIKKNNDRPKDIVEKIFSKHKKFISKTLSYVSERIPEELTSQAPEPDTTIDEFFDKVVCILISDYLRESAFWDTYDIRKHNKQIEKNIQKPFSDKQDKNTKKNTLHYVHNKLSGELPLQIPEPHTTIDEFIDKVVCILISEYLRESGYWPEYTERRYDYLKKRVKKNFGQLGTTTTKEKIVSTKADNALSYISEKLLVRLKKYKAPNKIEHFYNKVVTNLIKDCIKAKADEPTENEYEIQSQGGTPEEDLFKREKILTEKIILSAFNTGVSIPDSEFELIRPIILKLRKELELDCNPKAHLLLHLHYIDGKSVPEASEKVGWTKWQGYNFIKKNKKQLCKIVTPKERKVWIEIIKRNISKSK